MHAESHRLNIAFLTAHDLQTNERWSWTQILRHMVRALQEHCGEVTCIGPIQATERVIVHNLDRATRWFLNKRFPDDHWMPLAKRYGRVAAERLAGNPFDVIVAPCGEMEVALLESDVPIVLVEDATYGLLIDYYPGYSNVLKRGIRDLHAIEDLALKRASAIVCSTEWAARSAIVDYRVDPRKVHVVSFGANLDNPPQREVALAKSESGRCRLLFVGGEWDRKGGEIAFETLLSLESMGIQTELTVCGCTPPQPLSHPHLTIMPRLDKRDPKQGKQLEDLYSMADFFLMPTRADCSPIVFCEANAFGLPVISTDTGGVSGVIRSGENGFLLSLSARGSAYAAVIAELYRDRQRYAGLVKSSRAAYEDHLNWDAWGLAMKNILLDLWRQRSTTSRDPVRN